MEPSNIKFLDKSELSCNFGLQNRNSQIVDLLSATEAFNTVISALSTKIYVQDIARESDVSAVYPNTLSIIKIEKEKFDQMVADNTLLSSNVLYILSSDYMDAYGQVLKNLSVLGYDETSQAANTSFVMSAIISTKIEIEEELTSLVNQTSTLLSNDYVKKIGDLSTALSTDLKGLSSQVKAISIDLSTDYDQKVFGLSNSISSKIYVQDIAREGNLSSVYPDTLSVIKIEKEKFDQMVADNTLLSSNVLYIISSDYIDAYGQVLTNLSVLDYQEVSQAANTSFVMSAILSTKTLVEKGIYNISTILSSDLSGLSSQTKTISIELSTDYSQKIYNLSNSISSKIYVQDIAREGNLSSVYPDTLSVIKIEKDKFDQMVVDDTILSANVLYIVSSDYMDAYGEKLVSLSTDGFGTSDAANINCVNAVSSYADDISSIVAVKSGVYLSSISSDGTEGGRLNNLNIYKFDSLETYETYKESINISDIVLIAEDNLNAGNDRIISVADPISDSDATNKRYVDSKSKNLATQISTDHEISSFYTNFTGSGSDAEIKSAVSAIYKLVQILAYK